MDDTNSNNSNNDNSLPNIEPYSVDPNSQGQDYTATQYDPNAVYEPNATNYDPNALYNPNAQMAYDPNLAYQPVETYTPDQNANFQYTDPQQYATTTTEYTEYQDTPRRKIPFPLILLGGVFTLGIIGLIFLLLSGSGGEKQNNNAADPDRQVVLEWWGVFMDPQVVQPLIDEYQAENPNVKIEYANKWPAARDFDIAASDYQQELNRVISGGDPVQVPDIFMVHNSWVGNYEAYSVPSNLITFSNFTEAYYQSAIVDFAQGGNVYGVPMWMDTLAILYNKDILAENNNNVLTPPTTWVEFRNFAQSLTKKEGQNILQAGFASGTPVNTSFSFELINLLLVQNGVQITDSANQPVFSTDPEAVGAFEFYSSFTKTSPTWNSNFKNDAAAFLERDVAMILATTWRYRDILKYNDQYQLGLDIGVAPVPQIQGQNQEFVNWAEYWGNMVSKDRPNSQYAWAFLEWINRPEQLRKLHTNIKNTSGYFGPLYARKDMSSDLQADEYLNIYNTSLPYAKTWYMVKGLQIKQLFVSFLERGSYSSSNIAQLEEEIKNLLLQKSVLTIPIGSN